MRVVAAAAAIAATFAIAGSAGAVRPCASRGAQTIVQNAKVRVYKQLTPDHTRTKYYGCIKRTNRRFQFDFVETEHGVAFDFHLAGYIVGYAMNYTDAAFEGSLGYVASYDLWRRKRLCQVNAATNPVGPYFVNKLVMTPTGALAWIGTSGLGSPDAVSQVHLADSKGDRIADSGKDIDVKSIALSGHTVTWTRAGVAKSATIGA